MRNFLQYVLLALVLVSFSCDAQKKTASSAKSDIQKIFLEEITRGSRRSVTITPTNKITDVNGKVVTTKVTAKQWESITKNLSSVSLKQLNSFEGPSTDRYFDGALAATIKITAAGKEYESKTFDSGKPPKELSEFYQLIAKDFK